MKTKSGEVEFDLTWDWTTPDAGVIYDLEWTEKPSSEFPDPMKSVLGLSHEKSNQLFLILSEKRGDESVYMAGPGSLEVISWKTIKLPSEFLKVIKTH